MPQNDANFGFGTPGSNLRRLTTLFGWTILTVRNLTRGLDAPCKEQDDRETSLKSQTGQSAGSAVTETTARWRRRPQAMLQRNRQPRLPGHGMEISIAPLSDRCPCTCRNERNRAARSAGRDQDRLPPPAGVADQDIVDRRAGRQ